MHKLFLAWALLAITVQGFRTRREPLVETQPPKFGWQENQTTKVSPASRTLSSGYRSSKFTPVKFLIKLLALNPSPSNHFIAGQGVKHTDLKPGLQRLGARSAVMQALLEHPEPKLDSDVPPPPAPPADSKRLGSGGGDDEASLHQVPASDAVELLDGWIEKVRALKMTGNEALEETYEGLDGPSMESHRGTLRASWTSRDFEDIEGLRSFIQNAPNFDLEDGQKMIMGMCGTDRTNILALAAGSLVKYPTTGWRAAVNKYYKIGGGAFLIKYISVNPDKLSAESSVADLQMRKGLRLMAEEIGVELKLPQGIA